MTRNQAFIKRWSSKLFPTESDQTWKKWVDFKDRSPRDLEDLLKDKEVKDMFKSRAIFLLLVPDLSLSPFYWSGNDRTSYSEYWVSFSLEGLSTDLLIYTAELIQEFYQQLKNQDRPYFDHVIRNYNAFIVELLKYLPQEEAEKVFQLFEINDTYEYWSLDEASGYNPLRSLFYARNVNENWKKKADDKMRQIIQNEVSGKTKARAEHENAPKCYARIIQDYLLYKTVPYSTDLFIDQVRFIVEETPSSLAKQRLFEPWHVAEIFLLIAATDDKDLLYKFSRSVLSSTEDPFWVYNTETLQAAELMQEAVKADPVLLKTLEELVRLGQQKMAEFDKHQQANKETEKAILEEMK